MSVISLDNQIINEQTFALGGKRYTAHYTPEIDQTYKDSNLEFMKIANKFQDTDKMMEVPVEELKQTIDDLEVKGRKHAKKYIRALFNKEDADALIQATSGRFGNLVNLMNVLVQAGENFGEFKVSEGNRQQRRAKA